MNGKDQILGRIRQALSQPAPKPGHNASRPPVRAGTAQEFSRWLPAVPTDQTGQLDLFARNSADLKTEFHLLPGVGALGPRLAELARDCGWSRVASHSGDLTRAALAEVPLPALWVDGGYDVEELERCDAGISECDALVAQTGSVLITSRSAGGRALSVLPPHHVVLVTREQMVPDLPAAYAALGRKYGSDLPSLISFITGPSRTGDIERILVLGAHGPKRLTILCG